MEGSTPPEGTLAAVRGMLATLLATLQVRLELLGTELGEERLRLLRVLLLGAVATFLLGAGTVFVAGALVLVMWQQHPLLALLLAALLFLAGGAFALHRALVLLRQPSKVFEASLAELARDRDALGG